MTTMRRPLIYVLWAFVIAAAVATGVVVQKLWTLRAEIEQLAASLTLHVGPESTLIYDADGTVVSALFEEHRIAVPLEEISPQMIAAVLSVEDRRFYEHRGIDVRRIVMAALANLRAGEIVQGGSTLTQQLVRSIALNRERSYARKFKEAVLAWRLEEGNTKRAILEAYLNRVYFGDGYYGVEAAARGYFGKTSSDLGYAEAALLAGLIKGPSLYSPSAAPALARQRRDLVLALMHSAGALRDEDYHHAVTQPLSAQLARDPESSLPNLRRAGAEYFLSEVERRLVQQFGSEVVYTGGLRVYTTLDRSVQAAAEEAIATRLERLDRSSGDPLQGALVALDPRTGHVKAIVGGRDFSESPFNRAIDARRQPGSAFKPFVYAMALESGYGLSSELSNLDEPIVTPQGPWLPRGEHEYGSVRLREALVVSSNRAAAHLLQHVGIHRTVDLVQRFGVRSPMPAVPSLALGTGEMTLLELTSAYGVFANRGRWRAPTLIARVVDRHGREVHRAADTERPVISEATAYLMTSVMADVIDRGTATNARRSGFNRRAAGKTGTSQSYADAWFVGYTPQLVAGVWFGFDRPDTIMERGFANVVAVPAWARFMKAAHDGAAGERWFERPSSLTEVRLCRLSGDLATERCNEPILELPDYVDAHPNWYAPPIVREGGVYAELRHGTRLPPTCILPHGEGLPAHAAETALTGVSAHEAWDAARPGGAGIVMHAAPADVPASLRPRPVPVLVARPVP